MLFEIQKDENAKLKKKEYNNICAYDQSQNGERGKRGLECNEHYGIKRGDLCPAVGYQRAEDGR